MQGAGLGFRDPSNWRRSVMRRPLRWLALGCMAVLGAATVVAGSAAADDKAKGPGEPTCKTYGTSVHFEQTPSAAAKRAEKEEKLVLVLHISGIFEDPNLT